MTRVVVTLALFLAPALVSASTERYVVALKSSVRGDRAGILLREIDVAPRERTVVPFENLDAFAADLTEVEVRELRRSANVRYVEPVAERFILGTIGPAATDAFRNLDGQTIPAGIDIVHAREVWNVTRGETINVVVMDTGIDYHHPDLLDAFAGGYNAITQSNDAMDDHNHGTHVAGSIAATDNELGVVGVAPKVRLWGVKAVRETGLGTTDHIVAGINWVIGQKRSLGGNWIINLSIGAQSPNTAEREAIARAISEGILIVAASGNDSTDTSPLPVSYPAAYPGVLAIGAVDEHLEHASFSNRGPQLGAVAPGVDVISSVRAGSGVLSAVVTDTLAYGGTALEGSGKGTVTGKVVYCGVGRLSEFTSAVDGQIAVVRRGGDITFAEKARRAKAAGAKAVLIVNYAESTVNHFSLIDAGDRDARTFDWPVTLALTNADGELLIAAQGATITVANRIDDYTVKSGTSMAAPHAAGVAALAWSVAPTATAIHVINALKTTAVDLGDEGVDALYGHGVLSAQAAAKMMNPAAFGLPVPPPTGRRVLRRGTR